MGYRNSRSEKQRRRHLMARNEDVQLISNWPPKRLRRWLVKCDAENFRESFLDHSDACDEAAEISSTFEDDGPEAQVIDRKTGKVDITYRNGTWVDVDGLMKAKPG